MINSNLLAQAHQLIPYEKIMLKKFISSDPNDVGLMVDTYATPVQALVKLNAITTKVKKEHGLDYKTNYLKLHSTPNVEGLSRVNNGDQFTFNGLLYKVESASGWKPIAGWDIFLCVQVAK